MAKNATAEVTRDLPPLSLRAAVRPETVDGEKRTAEMVWTTGARVLRGGFWQDPFWEELSTDPAHVRLERLNNGAPLLATHSQRDLAAVLGVVESARMEKGSGVAVVRFARAEDDPAADQAFRKVKDGILQNVSVGYRIHKMERVERGEPEKGTYDVMRAVDWEPYELSVVPVGADDGAGFRGQDAAPNHCIIVTREETNMADEKNPETPPAADPTDALVAEARQSNARATAETDKIRREAADAGAAEARERITQTMKLVARTKLGDAFAEKLIKANTPLDKVREIVLNELANEDERNHIDGHSSFEAGDDARDKFVRGGVASILDRSGQAELVQRAREVKRLARQFDGVATDPGEFRGMRLIDLARRSLELRGVSVRGLFGDALVKRALEYRGDAGFNTISDFAVLLETAVNKVFLGGYATADVTWPRWCARKAVNDFRTSTFYRPGSFGVLDTVTEAGEIKHKNIPDGAKRTLTPATKGNIIGITRRAIVNDDLGAFRDLGGGLGAAAALSIETDAFALVTANGGLGVSYDANPLFHSSRNNIGPAGAMSVTTLDGARAVMAKQKDPSANQFLAIRPAVWLGPVELGGVAKQLNSSTTDPTDNKAQGVSNRILNLVRDVVDSPFLSASSATRHYLVGDPGIYPVFAVGFIDGNEAPRMESEQVFGYDGMQMKVVLDYGTAVLDFRGAVTCPGA